MTKQNIGSIGCRATLVAALATLGACVAPPEEPADGEDTNDPGDGVVRGEYTGLYDAATVALARPWDFDDYVDVNSSRFGQAFRQCLSMKRAAAWQTARDATETCSAIYPPNPNATSCQVASDASSTVALFDDMAKAIDGQLAFEDSATGRNELFVAEQIGRDYYTRLVLQALQTPESRSALTCVF
jgi:hypothetical protein